MKGKKPVMFIASSVEGLDYANGIETNLQFDCVSHKWSNIFESGFSPIENLMDELSKVDFAAFIFSPDDILKIREEEHITVRDNVIFELGLFMGHLGRDRVFMIKPENDKTLKLPTDLNGIGNLTYNNDENFRIRTSIASNSIRERMRKLGSIKRKVNKVVNKEIKYDQLLEYLQILYLLKERGKLGLTEIYTECGLSSRKRLVEFIFELEKSELIVKTEENKKVKWDLSTKGMDKFKN